MNKPASYSRSGPVGNIVMDDGKLNIMSVDMLAALHRAFDEAERDKTVAVLSGRGKAFSAGFDLNVFAEGTAEGDARDDEIRRRARLAAAFVSDAGGRRLQRPRPADGRLSADVVRHPHRRRGYLLASA